MTMEAQLASLLAASALWGVPSAMAVPTIDDFEIELQGKFQGWLNLTCTYYDIGWLSEEQASKAIRRLMVLIKGDYLGEDLARQAKKIALERSPGCRAVWPETAE